MNTTQASLCEGCPPGFFCVDSAIWPVACPPGEVCSGYTGYNRTLCPQGTYGPGTGLTDESECTQCDGGHYCDTMGMSSIGPECYPGYYCREGVNTPAPSENNTGDGSKY